MQDATFVKAVADLAQASVTKPALIELDGSSKPVLVRQLTNGNVEFHDLEKFLTAPTAVRCAVKLLNLPSFIAYFNRFKTPGTTVFFNPEDLTFTAVFDYHEDPTTPRWGVHTATYKVEHSNEWDTWWGRHKKEFGQVGFGEFIQENLADVLEPEGAELLEMALNFEATKTSEFRSAQRLSDGTFKFTFNEDIKTGDVSVPTSIVLRIPVFFGGSTRDITLRFKYRIVDGKLQFRYEFAHPDRIIDEEAKLIVSEFEKVHPVLFGARA